MDDQQVDLLRRTPATGMQEAETIAKVLGDEDEVIHVYEEDENVKLKVNTATCARCFSLRLTSAVLCCCAAHPAAVSVRAAALHELHASLESK
eukprot:COSAG04_NODE_17682_length_462_cov_0.730028_2_plen_92_part_01